MIGSPNSQEAHWAAVDDYIAGRLLISDPTLDGALAASTAAGLPEIAVAPVQGKMLMLLARMAGARRVLEIGTLGGYSTIWLARALSAGGKLISLELDPNRAEVARHNIAHAGLAENVEVRVGLAVNTLESMMEAGERPFDLIFIDADKASNVAYLDAALSLSRAGTVLIADNVIRNGEVLDADSDNPSVRGTRLLFDAVAAEPRLSATAIQTVGDKGWDGFLLAVVND